MFKGGKKKSHALYPLSFCELTFYQRNDSAMANLTAVEPALRTSFQMQPVKSTVAFFMAEVFQKCVHEDAEDPHMFEFMKQQVEYLDSASEVWRPLEFIIRLTEQLGIQPLVENPSGSFNVEEGVVDVGLKGKCYQGESVELITSLILGDPVMASGSTRRESLEIMLEYYRLHLPNFGAISSYEIVREILYS